MKSKYYAINEEKRVIWAGDHMAFVKHQAEEDVDLTAHIYNWESLGEDFWEHATPAAYIVSGRRVVAAYYWGKGWERRGGPSPAGLLEAVKTYEAEKAERLETILAEKAAVEEKAEQIEMTLDENIQEENNDTIINIEEEETMKDETIVTVTEEEPEVVNADWGTDRLAEIPDEVTREKVAALVNVYPAVYNRLYAQDEVTPQNYSEELALFDAWLGTPICCSFISHCENVRGDVFFSDRERAAFVVACEELRAARKDPEAALAQRIETISNDEPTATEEVAPAASEKPARAAAKEKTFAGEAISGHGWSIVFDTGMQRTRVIIQDGLREKLAPIVEGAGFYFSKNMGSWNKKLTHKAHRAALALAASLNAAVA